VDNAKSPAFVLIVIPDNKLATVLRRVLHVRAPGASGEQRRERGHERVYRRASDAVALDIAPVFVILLADNLRGRLRICAVQFVNDVHSVSPVQSRAVAWARR